MLLDNFRRYGRSRPYQAHSSRHTTEMTISRRVLTEHQPATAGVIARLRNAVADYAQSIGIDGMKLDAVRLAASEALTNVVLHAYSDRPGLMHVTARANRDELRVIIADDGRGPNATAIRPGLGLGLGIIADCCDQFSLTQRPGGGTQTTMVFNLPGHP